MDRVAFNRAAAPAALFKCPILLLIEPSRGASFLKEVCEQSAMVVASTLSPTCVLVPWHSKYSTVPISIPDSAYVRSIASR